MSDSDLGNSDLWRFNCTYIEKKTWIQLHTNNIYMQNYDKKKDDPRKIETGCNTHTNTHTKSNPYCGCEMPILSNMRENLNLFSAPSMDSGEVPRMCAFWWWRSRAMLLGSCPPMLRMMPRGFSKLYISITT